MSFKVKKFNPCTMKPHRIVFIIGKRHTGKSVLMKDLLYHMPRPDFVLAMAPTEDTLAMFREFIPNACIYDHFNQDALDKVVAVQKELVAKGKTRNIMILLDDCLYQKNVLKSTSMRHIFFNGRHDNITFLCAAQYMMDVDVSLRTNIDYIFTMRETILTNRQKLYKYYFGQFHKFADFDIVMQTCTSDYRCLVLDGTLSCTTPTDAIMWYKAKTDIEPFKLCSASIWSLHKRCAYSLEQIRQKQSMQFKASTDPTVSNFEHVEPQDENGKAVIAKTM